MKCNYTENDKNIYELVIEYYNLVHFTEKL